MPFSAALLVRPISSRFSRNPFDILELQHVELQPLR
jgi:hypothetical protein